MIHWDEEEDKGDTPDWLERLMPQVMAVFALALGGSALMFAIEEGRWDLAGIGFAALLVAWCFYREAR